ncbi:hypothetical protein, partial [Neisseria meningitidis]
FFAKKCKFSGCVFAIRGFRPPVREKAIIFLLRQTIILLSILKISMLIDTMSKHRRFLKPFRRIRFYAV